MKLSTDLAAALVKHTSDGCTQEVKAVADADGLFFLCPGCYQKNGGSVGTHSVLCWFVGKVPEDLKPLPGRWVPAGTTVDDLSFIGPRAASVGLPCWHGFIRNGEAVPA